MQVAREAVVELLLAIGYKGAAKYDDDKILDRLNKLPDNMPEDEVPEEHQDLLDSIVKAVESEEELELVEEDEAPATDGKAKKKAAPAKATKPAKKVAEAKTTAKAEKKGTKTTAKAGAGKKEAKAKKASKVERDKFGSALSSQSAQINKTFANKAKTADQIVKESGVENANRVRSHIYWMVRHGHVKKTDKGYALV